MHASGGMREAPRQNIPQVCRSIQKKIDIEMDHYIWESGYVWRKWQLDLYRISPVES
jgi:hypothetical protein